MLLRWLLKKKGFSLLTLSPEYKFQLLKEVFENGEELKNGELVNQMKIVVNKSFSGRKGIGLDNIKKLITESRDEGWIIQEGIRQPYKLGKLSV